MSNKRVAITGIGVISSIGIGKDAFWSALEEGKSGIRPVSLFDTSDCKSHLAGEIPDFKAEDFLGPRGHRTLDRSTKLICSAAKLALDDAKIEPNTAITEDAGMVLGSTMGSIWSISEFDKDALRDGPRYVDPMRFPNTVINSPASQVSIKFGIRGFNTTISTGFSASLDAIGYALDFMRLNRADIILVGGVEELCIQTFLGFYKIGIMAGSRDGRPEISAPFDKKRNGIIFGEGAGVIVIEDIEHAKSRNATIYGEILGFGTAFDPRRRNGYNPKAEGATRAIQNTLDDSGISLNEIDYISACANSTLECDVMEARAIRNIFAQRTQKIPVSAIKSMVGECFSASSILQVISSLGTLNRGIIPPTINFESIDDRCNFLNIVGLNGAPKKANINKILVNSFGPSGCNSSLLISKAGNF